MSLQALIQRRATNAVPPVPPVNQHEGTGKPFTEQSGSLSSPGSLEKNEKVEGTEPGRDVGSRPHNVDERTGRTIHFSENEGTREPKPVVLAASANDPEPVISHRLWWILHGPDDWRLHSFSPPASLVEVQGWYPGTVEVEPETTPTPPVPVTLPPDDRRTCRQCRNLARNGRCMAAGAGRLPMTGNLYEPDQAALQRCAGYAPGADDPDRRPGKERYPGLYGRLWAMAKETKR